MVRSVIVGLLRTLPRLFSHQKNPEPTLLPTLESAMASLSDTGGKIVCGLASLPTWGPGRLHLRDKNDLHGIETEKKLFQTEHPGFRRIASKLVQSGIGIDFFLAAAGGKYMDVATIGLFEPSRTGQTDADGSQVMHRLYLVGRRICTPTSLLSVTAFSLLRSLSILSPVRQAIKP